MTKFNVTQGDLSLQVGFSHPAFELLKPTTPLHENVYRRLQKHGLRLADVRPSRPSETLDNLRAEYNLFNYQLTLNVGLDRAEAHTFDTKQVPLPQLFETFRDFISGLHDTIPTLTFKTLSLTLQIHGTTSDNKARDFPFKFIKDPPSIGPLASAGVIFTFGASQDQLTSSVIIEHSHAVANGLFLRLLSAWDPARVTIDTLKPSIDTFLTSASTQLGLDIHGI